jgi:hypothetical protein
MAEVGTAPSLRPRANVDNEWVAICPTTNLLAG